MFSSTPRTALLLAAVATMALTSLAADDSCTWADDGECDEPQWCDDGTDCTDCGTCDGGTAVEPKGSAMVTAMFRDMTAAHPDFKEFYGSGEKNCVEKQLGANDKPVLSGSCVGFTTSANFDQWSVLQFVW
jgi:hypothetical protein